MIDFDQSMKKLKSVNGYIGSAVLNFAGETLYIDEENTGIDIAYASSIFNDSFRTITEVSLDVGFSDASFVETKTKDGHVLLINSVGDASGDNLSKLNIFAIFRDDGNIALAKMVMERTSQAISKEMSAL